MDMRPCACLSLRSLWLPRGCQMNAAAVSGVTSRHNNTEDKKIGCFFLLFYFKERKHFPDASWLIDEG